MFVPAVCPIHGVFSLEMPFGPGSLIKLTSCFTNCPFCNRRVPIVDGVYEFVGNVVRIFTEAKPSRDELTELRAVAAKVRSGSLRQEEARARVSKINPALASLADQAKDQVALWAILIAIIALYVQICSAVSDDDATAQAHQDAQDQITATKSVEEAQQKIYVELRQQADAATAKAQAEQTPKAPRARTPAQDEKRRAKRKAAKSARKGGKR